MQSIRVEFGIGIGEDEHGRPIDDVDARIYRALLVITPHTRGAFLTHGSGAWYDAVATRTILEKAITITTDLPVNQEKGEMERVQNIIGELADRLIDIFQQKAIHVTTHRVFSYDHKLADPVETEENAPEAD